MRIIRFYTLKTKSAVLRAMGRDGDADGVMDEAVATADAPVMGIHQYGTALLAAGKKDKAMAIFTQSASWPDRGHCSPLGPFTFVTNCTACARRRAHGKRLAVAWGRDSFCIVPL